MSNDNKTWLITGVSSGLGKSLANEVLKRNGIVIGSFRKKEQVEAFSRAQPGKSFGYVMDLKHADTIQQFSQTVIENHGIPDVLVNNAGSGFAGAVEEASMDELRNLMEVNFFGPVHLTRQFLPGLREKGTGMIIQISSHAGIRSFAGFGIYNASKFALEGISEAMAQEVKPFGIRVTLVEPGPFRTAFAGEGLVKSSHELAAYQDTAGAFRSKLNSVHGQQEGDPDKAAEAIFMLSEMSDPPMRLPLGRTALKTIQDKINWIQSDLDQGSSIAESVCFS